MLHAIVNDELDMYIDDTVFTWWLMYFKDIPRLLIDCLRIDTQYSNTVTTVQNQNTSFEQAI